jgi:hypothetical protein
MFEIMIVAIERSIIIVVIAMWLAVLPLVGLELCRNHEYYDEKILRALGIRHLTFQRKSDILIAIGLVGSFLAAILVMGR